MVVDGGRTSLDSLAPAEREAGDRDPGATGRARPFVAVVEAADDSGAADMDLGVFGHHDGARLPEVSKVTVYRQVALLTEGGFLEVDGEQRREEAPSSAVTGCAGTGPRSTPARRPRCRSKTTAGASPRPWPS
jgi:hypothetical protein